MTNPFKPHALVHGFAPTIFHGRVIALDEPKGPKGENPKMRARVRLVGLQDDYNSIPDTMLPWYDIVVPPNSQGRSPYLKPGTQVLVTNFGGAAGTTATAYVTAITDFYPPTPSMQGEEGPIKVPSIDTIPPPGKNSQRAPRPVVAGYDTTEDNTTQQSREKDHSYAHKKRNTDPEQNFHKQMNEFEERGIKFANDKTTGLHKFDNQGDAQKFIKNSINNQGAFMPTALQMIQNLKKVGNGQNPTAVASVGAGNLSAAKSARSNYYSQKQQPQPNPCALLDTAPETVSPQQIEECCKLENRRNLSKKGREYCEYLDSLKEIAQANSDFQVEEGIIDIDPNQVDIG
jgi:hypothetical protein